MKVLIAENGQNVVESSRYMSKKGHKIFFATPFADSIKKRIFFSKSYSKIINLKKTNSDSGKIKNLKKIYDKFSCDVFFPFGYNLVTEYINQSFNNRELVMNSPYGCYSDYWNLSNKFNLYSLLKDTKILLPKFYGKISLGEKTNFNQGSFPIIVKRVAGVGIKNNVRIAWTNNQIQKIIKELHNNKEKTDKFILQQYIPGYIFDVGGFSIDGIVYYNIPQRRTITYPLRGGVAAVNDIYDDPKLLYLARLIINKTRWTGPFQTEFKYNPNDKKYYLLEVNAKMWGSLPLSLKANPDLLDIALNVAVGKEVKKSLNFKKSLRYRWICEQEIRAIANGNIHDKIEFIRYFFYRKSFYDIDLNDIGPDLKRLFGSIATIAFKKYKLTKPLIDKKFYNSNKKIG